ncbi:MAG: CoA-binding protein [Acidimicrobiales bacterium]|nr:CoA-binding protein [Acidimicrobiales bacterium]
MSVDLTPLFEPRGVIVTGVSTHPGKFGFVTLHNILTCGYEGPVYAVGREAGTVLGRPVLASVEEVPADSADLLVICTPVSVNEEILVSAAAKGVGAVFVAAGGYSESGPEGITAEARLASLANELGLVLAGPNGQGVVSTPVGLCAQIVAPFPPRGCIGVASQSGNLVSAFLNLAEQTGIGISRSVSAGNAASTGLVDYLEWFADDPETDVALCYIEGLPDGRDFFKRVRQVSTQMPVVVIKGGATSGGQRAAASHTGSLASDDRIFDGMARQAGLLRAPTVEAAFDTAATFATQPLPQGDNVVVLTTAGGWGVIAADAVTAHPDLMLSALPDDLFASIDEILPLRWSRNNPVDLAGGETRETIPDLLHLVAGHPDVDSIIQLGLGIQGNTAALTRSGPFYPDHGLERIVAFHERQEHLYATAAAEASAANSKPVLVASELATAWPDNPMVAAVRDSGRLCYSSADRAIAALGHVARYAAWRRERT